MHLFHSFYYTGTNSRLQILFFKREFDFANKFFLNLYLCSKVSKLVTASSMCILLYDMHLSVALLCGSNIIMRVKHYYAGQTLLRGSNIIMWVKHYYAGQTLLCGSNIILWVKYFVLLCAYHIWNVQQNVHFALLNAL